MANNNFDSNHESMKRESRKDYQEKQPKKTFVDANS